MAWESILEGVKQRHRHGASFDPRCLGALRLDPAAHDVDQLVACQIDLLGRAVQRRLFPIVSQIRIGLGQASLGCLYKELHQRLLGAGAMIHRSENVGDIRDCRYRRDRNTPAQKARARQIFHDTSPVAPPYCLTG
jgi:hypothetical protein